MDKTNAPTRWKQFADRFQRIIKQILQNLNDLVNAIYYPVLIIQDFNTFVKLFKRKSVW